MHDISGNERLDMNKPRILLIDDDIHLRKTLADILNVNGYDTVTAKDGAEGLALFEQNPVNVVLIDLMLPDMPGLRILERIKTVHPATEAIILTGNASLDTAIEATNQGAFSYLVKPYEVDQLIINVKRAIEKQHAEEQIIRNSFELQRINAELKALHEVSLAISREMDMDRLLLEVLRTLVDMEIFRFEHKGLISLNGDDGLRLISHIGLSEDEMERCRNIMLGECLCGLAAASGEIIISRNVLEDKRHSIRDHCMPQHGHIILPLKTPNTVLGVLALFIQADIEVDEREIKLLTTIANQIGIAINNSKLYEEAKSFSLHDPLTGLPNRRSLQIQMEKSIDTAIRYEEKLSVIMLDIDHFKIYNDTFGHLEGDRMLVKLAAILSHEMRNSDYVFRYGGEEFLALLPQTDLTLACEVAERLRKSVETEAGITISLGVSSYRENMLECEILISSADAALYQAKQQGRNRIIAIN
jgi:two-component system, cell cycle response regulator